jgi:hypothetical protein
MPGRKERVQIELLMTGSPGLDLSWLRGEVADLHNCDNGRPGTASSMTDG